MAHRLVRPKIGETSGVDHPAHGAEGWLVLKSGRPLSDHIIKEADVPPTPKTPAKPEDLSPEAQAYIDALEAERDSALEKAAGKPEPTPDPKADVELPEDVRKALDGMPDEIAKAVEAQFGEFRKEADQRIARAEAIAAHEREERERRDAVAKAADDFGRLPVPTEVGKSAGDIGLLLRNVAKAAEFAGEDFAKSAGLDAEDATPLVDQVKAVLKAANAQLEAADRMLLREVGTSLDSDGDPASEAEAKMQKAADKIRADEPELTEAQAYTKAIRANPELYAEINGE